MVQLSTHFLSSVALAFVAIQASAHPFAQDSDSDGLQQRDAFTGGDELVDRSPAGIGAIGGRIFGPLMRGGLKGALKSKPKVNAPKPKPKKAQKSKAKAVGKAGAAAVGKTGKIVADGYAQAKLRRELEEMSLDELVARLLGDDVDNEIIDRSFIDEDGMVERSFVEDGDLFDRSYLGDSEDDIFQREFVDDIDILFERTLADEDYEIVERLLDEEDALLLERSVGDEYDEMLERTFVEDTNLGDMD